MPTTGDWSSAPDDRVGGATDVAPPPRVSVIIIFLNAASFLAEAVDSVLGQSFADLELLLVDDGSTDGGSQLAMDYADRHPGRVRYLQHPGGVNRGMSATRNLGVAHARAELIAFIDADDVWVVDKLRDQVAIMDAHPQVGLCCGAVRYWSSWEGGQDVVTPTGRLHDHVVRPPRAILDMYPLGAGDAPCPSDLLMRRELVLAVGGFEERFTGFYEDQAFLTKIYLETPIYVSSRVWLHYRQHGASCVAQTGKEARYHQVRETFMAWLKDYLASRPQRPPAAVARALARATRRYRHPRLVRLLGKRHRAAEFARRLLR